ncbi:MAG: glutamine amidotransferase [Opitutus sp.]
MVAALTLSGSAWAWAALGAAVVLLPLAWLALRPLAPQRGSVAIGLALRTAGFGLLLLCLLDPQWTAPRAKQGANIIAVLADNSQGLSIIDAGAAHSRGAQMRTLLTTGGPWLDQLTRDFQVRRYTFDRSLRRVKDFDALDFSGDHTALGSALQQLRERFAGQPLAGVLLLSDGNATDLPSGVGDLTGLPPIYALPIGRSDGLRDVRIERTDARQTAFDDAPLAVGVDVAGTGASEEEMTVSIRPLEAHATDDENQTPAPSPQTVRLRADGQPTRLDFEWRSARPGVQFDEVTVAPRTTTTPEATDRNNRRVVMFNRGRPAYRILYVGGRPNWEFKFFNRALLEDPQLQLVGLLRLALREPKFEFRGRAGEASNPLFRGFGGNADDTTRYDQPVLTRINTRDQSELRGGFPRAAEDLYAYDAVVLDDVEAGFFSPDQLMLLRRFVADRGGGLMMLGGVNSLENGKYHDTALAPVLPVYLDRLAAKPPSGPMKLELTREGWLEPWTRIRAQETDEKARLQAMPPLLIANGLAGVKPGATVLASLTDEQGTSFPALISQPFGAGRVACIGIGDLWRWGQHDANDQADLARFWRQVSRWLVTDVPAQVEIRVIPAAEGTGVDLRVTAKDRAFRPLELATAQITVRRIESTTDLTAATASTSVFKQATLSAEPSSEAPGRYVAPFTARDPGAYLATVEVKDRAGLVVGRAETGWVHDPLAEEFRSITPNRALLQEITRRTGGALIEETDLNGLADRLAQAPAPITETASRSLWHNPWMFAAVLGCFLAEWAWRRWRGLP